MTLAPDGFERPIMAVNGQFPGPTIQAGNSSIFLEIYILLLTSSKTGVIPFEFVLRTS